MATYKEQVILALGAGTRFSRVVQFAYRPATVVIDIPPGSGARSVTLMVFMRRPFNNTINSHIHALAQEISKDTGIGMEAICYWDSGVTSS